MEGQCCQKKSTARELGNVGNLGNVTRFPRVLRCFSHESDFANDCQVGNVTPRLFRLGRLGNQGSDLAKQIQWFVTFKFSASGTLRSSDSEISRLQLPEKEAWFKKGSGTVAGTARRVLRTTVPDPFLDHAFHCTGSAISW